MLAGPTDQRSSWPRTSSSGAGPPRRLPPHRGSRSSVPSSRGARTSRRPGRGIVTKRHKLATEMMRPDTGLHADQAGWHIGKTCFHLAPRPLLPQHDCATLIETDDVERVLADIDTDHGDHTVELLSHGALLSLNASCQLTC